MPLHFATAYFCFCCALCNGLQSNFENRFDLLNRSETLSVETIFKVSIVKCLEVPYYVLLPRWKMGLTFHLWPYCDIPEHANNYLNSVNLVSSQSYVPWLRLTIGCYICFTRALQQYFDNFFMLLCILSVDVITLPTFK